MADAELALMNNVLEINTQYGLYREECRVYTRRYSCICNFWVSDESVMNDKVITDIMAFIISKNIMKAHVRTDDREFSLRIEMIIADEEGKNVPVAEIPSGVFNKILFTTVKAVGEKKFTVCDFYSVKKYFVDGKELSSEKINAFPDSENAEKFRKLIKDKKEILQKNGFSL